MTDQPITRDGELSSAEAKQIARSLKRGHNSGEQSSRDWLAIAIGMVSIVATMGSWIWWGGKLSDRVDHLEERQRLQETFNNQKASDDSNRSADIAVIKSQVTDIKRWVDKQEERHGR